MTPLFSRALLCFALAALPFAAAQARGPWHADAANTYGWQIMTPKERVEYQRRLRGFTRYEACESYERQHRARLAGRARETGVAVAPVPQSACRQLRERGDLR